MAPDNALIQLYVTQVVNDICATKRAAKIEPASTSLNEVMDAVCVQVRNALNTLAKNDNYQVNQTLNGATITHLPK